MDTLSLRQTASASVMVPMTLPVYVAGRQVAEIEAYARIERDAHGEIDVVEFGMPSLDDGRDVVIHHMMVCELGRRFARQLNALSEDRDQRERFEEALVAAEREDRL